MNLSKLLSFEQGRITFFETLTKHSENWQQNPTPLSIVRKMLDKTSLEDKKILIIFNIEFLQVLVEERKINPENIYYIADNELEYLSALKIFKVQSLKLSDYTVSALKKLIVGIDMKFDVVFSNPPYNKSIDIKILSEVYDVADEIVAIHPSTWLLDTKGTYNTYVTFRNKINRHVKSFELFNGNSAFGGIVVNTPIVISHINKNVNSNIRIDYFNDVFETENISDVTKFGSSWIYLIKPFMSKLKEQISVCGSVWENKVEATLTDDSKFYCQLADIIGNINITSKTFQMVKDDFYTLTIKNSQNNIGIRKTTIANTYCFNTDTERTNFLRYCETDFARFCLALTKNNTHVDTGEMKNIPWLDFTQEWNDEKLFEEFNVSQDLQDYIREFLPDYYGIRK